MDFSSYSTDDVRDHVSRLSSHWVARSRTRHYQLPRRKRCSQDKQILCRLPYPYLSLVKAISFRRYLKSTDLRQTSVIGTSLPSNCKCQREKFRFPAHIIQSPNQNSGETRTFSSSDDPVILRCRDLGKVLRYSCVPPFPNKSSQRLVDTTNIVNIEVMDDDIK